MSRVNILYIAPLLLSVLFSAPSSTAEANDKQMHVSVVGAGVISTPAQEFGAAITPRGSTLYYTYSDNGYTHMTILRSDQNGNTWSVPEVASFSGTWNDADPSFRPDGKRIYFISNRPVDAVVNSTLEIWYVEKRTNGWSDAKSVNALLLLEGSKSYPSIATDGSLYFTMRGQVYVSAYKDGKHQEAEKLPLKSGAVSIAPDQSFMILQLRDMKTRSSNLGTSRFENGIWSEPKKMPEPVNSRFSESSPNISADGKTLYFTSDRLDYSKIKWPRQKPAQSFKQVKNELAAQWQNRLRNIYKVELTSVSTSVGE